MLRTQLHNVFVVVVLNPAATYLFWQYCGCCKQFHHPQSHSDFCTLGLCWGVGGVSKKKKNATLLKSLGCEILSSGSGRRLEENDTLSSRLRTLAFLTSCSVQSLVVSVTSRTRFEHRPAKTNPCEKSKFQQLRSSFFPLSCV